MSRDDTISRHAAMEMKFSHGINEDGRLYVPFSEVINGLENLPAVQPEQQWIPCSERFPGAGTYVLVSKKPLNFKSNLPNVCMAHRSRDPRSGKEEWNDMLFGKLDDDDVLAWMLLPEPYAERRTE